MDNFQTQPVFGEVLSTEEGLTKREQIATQLLAALIVADAAIWARDPDGCSPNKVKDAIALTDNLLEKLSQPKSKAED